MFFPVAYKGLYSSMPMAPVLTLGIIMADQIVDWVTLLSEPEVTKLSPYYHRDMPGFIINCAVSKAFSLFN